VRATWTLYEVLDAHEVLDAEAAAQVIAAEISDRQAKRR
jgi:hypothetical protein